MTSKWTKKVFKRSGDIRGQNLARLWSDKTSLTQQPKLVIPGSLLGFGKCYFNFLLNILHVFYAKYAH